VQLHALTGWAPQASDTKEAMPLGGTPARANGVPPGRAQARAPVVLDADGARAQRAAALGPARAAGPAGVRVAARRERLLVLPRGAAVGVKLSDRAPDPTSF